MNQKEIHNALNEAIQLAEQKEMSEAAVRFEQLLENAPNDIQVVYNAGVFYSQNGEHLKAVDCFRSACELDGKNSQFWIRLATEEYHVGSGDVFDDDFLAFDPIYLDSAKEHCNKAIENDGGREAEDLLKRIEVAVMKNKCAFKFIEGDLEYCRRTLSRKTDVTNLDQRVLGFLNLLDSGEYEFVKGKFNVFARDDLPKNPKGGFLDRIRNWVLGK
jgi:tetratricopeptide (TPR) repeat protein